MHIFDSIPTHYSTHNIFESNCTCHSMNTTHSYSPEYLLTPALSPFSQNMSILNFVIEDSSSLSNEASLLSISMSHAQMNSTMLKMMVSL